MPLVYKVNNGLFEPKYIPSNGDTVELGTPVNRGAVSIAVGENWKIHQEVLLFDTLSFVSGKTLIIFQVQPLNDPGYGKFVEIRRERLEQNPRHNGSNRAVHYGGSE